MGVHYERAAHLVSELQMDLPAIKNDRERPNSTKGAHSIKYGPGRARDNRRRTTGGPGSGSALCQRGSASV